MNIRPQIQNDICFHGRQVGVLLNVSLEPIDAYLKQCNCCLNVFPTRDSSVAFCPECQGPLKLVLPYQGV